MQCIGWLFSKKRKVFNAKFMKDKKKSKKKTKQEANLNLRLSKINFDKLAKSVHN